MKRKYEAVRIELGRRSLKIVVIVHEIGPAWKFHLEVPYEHLDAKALYEAITEEQERWRRYVHLGEGHVEDVLW